jgi:hypothetical protein
MLNNDRDEGEGRAAIDAAALELAEFGGESSAHKTP